ncbi:MAG: hypothetical protein O3A01_06660, partial [bacterium]|nr:hypothetical protein [bacterium]
MEPFSRARAGAGVERGQGAQKRPGMLDKAPENLMALSKKEGYISLKKVAETFDKEFLKCGNSGPASEVKKQVLLAGMSRICMTAVKDHGTMNCHQAAKMIFTMAAKVGGGFAASRLGQKMAAVLNNASPVLAFLTEAKTGIHFQNGGKGELIGRSDLTSSPTQEIAFDAFVAILGISEEKGDFVKAQTSPSGSTHSSGSSGSAEASGDEGSLVDADGNPLYDALPNFRPPTSSLSELYQTMESAAMAKDARSAAAQAGAAPDLPPKAREQVAARADFPKHANPDYESLAQFTTHTTANSGTVLVKALREAESDKRLDIDLIPKGSYFEVTLSNGTDKRYIYRALSEVRNEAGKVSISEGQIAAGMEAPEGYNKLSTQVANQVLSQVNALSAQSPASSPAEAPRESNPVDVSRWGSTSSSGSQASSSSLSSADWAFPIAPNPEYESLAQF